jgi:hypothetical protein
MSFWPFFVLSVQTGKPGGPAGSPVFDRFLTGFGGLIPVSSQNGFAH